MSVGPPGGNGTTSRTGRSGYSARAGPAARSSRAISAASRRTSVDLGAGELHEVAPLGDLGLDEGGRAGRRRIVDRVDAGLDHALGRRRVLERLVLGGFLLVVVWLWRVGGRLVVV